MLVPFVFVVVSYLLGAIPFGLVLGIVWGKVDVREYGSGNIGTTNVLRTLGVVPAVLAATGDICKGLIPVYLSIRIFDQPWLTVLVGLVTIVGHNWPIYLRFKGGRGVATTIGVLGGFHLIPTLVVAAVWIFLVAATKYVSLASLVAVSLTPVVFWYFGAPWEYLLFGVVAALSVIYRHRGNIHRLRVGTEPKIGQKAKKNEV